MDSGPNSTFTRIEPNAWLELAELKEGGYAVFELDYMDNKRRPVFACSNIDQLFEYIKVKLSFRKNKEI